MSIASEITRINTNIASSYTACNNKGATLPTTQNSANLPACISSIPSGSSAVLGTKNITANGTYNASADGYDGYSSVNVSVSGGSGGGVPTGKYKVWFTDYRGYTWATASGNTRDVITFPTPPAIPGMIFEAWTATETITNNTITIGEEDVTVGAIYKTASGKTEIYLDIYSDTVLDIPNFKITKRLSMSTLTVDWGDGTSTVDTTTATAINLSHTYASTGKYVIKVDCGTDPYCLGGSQGMFGQSYSAQNTTVKKILCSEYMVLLCASATQHCMEMVEFSFSNEARGRLTNPNIITSQAFNSNYALMAIVLPYEYEYLGAIFMQTSYNIRYICVPRNVEIPTITNNTFYGAYSVEHITIPLAYTSLGNAFCRAAQTAKNFVISENVYEIGANCFYGAQSCDKFIFKGAITSILANAFSGCRTTSLFDFTNCTDVPVLANINAFTGIMNTCKIVVPDSLLDEWKVASNWTTYVNNIVSRTDYLANGGTL